MTTFSTPCLAFAAVLLAGFAAGRPVQAAGDAGVSARAELFERDVRTVLEKHCVRYPEYGRNGHKTVGNWYNTLLQANGFPRQDYFGQPDGKLKGIDMKGVLQELVV